MYAIKLRQPEQRHGVQPGEEEGHENKTPEVPRLRNDR